jgi:hypothetical protein
MFDTNLGVQMSAAGPSGPHERAVLTDQMLIIEGESIRVEHRRMSLKDVKLDATNPRIRHAVKRVSQNGQISQDELLKLILDQPGVSELFKSIRDNGGILEPIYIRPDGRIIEGNCRAASYFKLNAIKKDDARWQTIPAVFVPSISDRQVAILQGQYHVAGKNKWFAYEKAGHLHYMHTNLKMDEKAIGQALGMRESDVIRDLKAYQVMTQKLLPKMPSGNGLEKWSFVQELFKRKGLEEYRSKPENVDEFVSLVVDKKLKQGADVRRLEKILRHPSAVKTLKKQGVNDAMSVVGKADPTADSRTFQKLKEVTELLKHLQKKDMERLREEKPRKLLQELFAAIKEAAKATGVKLS